MRPTFCLDPEGMAEQYRRLVLRHVLIHHLDRIHGQDRLRVCRGATVRAGCPRLVTHRLHTQCRESRSPARAGRTGCCGFSPECSRSLPKPAPPVRAAPAQYLHIYTMLYYHASTPIHVGIDGRLQTQVQHQIITCPSLTLPPIMTAVCLPVGPSESGLHVPPECLQVHTVLQEVCPVPDHGPDEELRVRHSDITWPSPHQRCVPSLTTRIAFSTFSLPIVNIPDWICLPHPAKAG